MPQIDVIAVVGPRAPERVRCAKRLAERTGRAFIPATRLATAVDPIQEALMLAPWATPSGGAVVEFPASSSAIELIGALAEPGAPTRLLAVVCVVDAEDLGADLADDGYVSGIAPGGDIEHTARAWLTATQLEFATTIVLANIDRVTPAHREDLIGVVELMAPTARLHLAESDSPAPVPVDTFPVGIGQDSAGWSRAVSGDAIRPARGRASAFRYENVRPLHPWRFHDLLEDRFASGEFGSIVRSAGFCRLATRPGIVAQWEQVGAMFDLAPLGSFDLLDDGDELLALGQDVFVAGLDLDRPGLTAALDETALTDDELLAGPGAWRTYADPFPEWLVSGTSDP